MKIPARNAVAFGTFVVALVFPVHRLLSGRGFVLQHDFFFSDLIHNQFPYRAYIGAALRHGSFPMWIPEIYSGCPLLPQIEAGLLFLPNWIVFGVLEPYRALDLAILLTILAGGAGMWKLCRVYGADGWGAALGGFAFAYCGFNAAHIKHMNMHEAAVMLPWLVLALEKGLRSRKTGPFVLLSFLLALQVFAGHPQITYITLLFLTARTISHAFPALGIGKHGRAHTLDKELLADATRAVTAMVLGLGLACVLLVPTWQFNATSVRGPELTWEFASGFPYFLPDLATFVYPEATGTQANLDYRGTVEWENYGYCGLAPLLLAAFAWWRFRRSKLVWFFGGALVIAMLLVVGPATPLYRLLWEVLPGMDLFRFPTRFLLIVDLSLAVLASLATTELRRWLGRRSRPRTGSVVVGVIVILTVVDLWYWQSRRIPVDDVDAWRPRGPVAEAILARETTGRTYTIMPKVYWRTATLAARGFSKGFEPYRTSGMVPLGNYSLIQGLRNVSGYTNMLSTRNGVFWQEYNQSLLPHVFQPDPFDPETHELSVSLQSLLDRANVQFIVSPVKIAGSRQRPLWMGEVAVYENPSALPRAYVATSWVPTSTLEESAQWMLTDGVDLARVPAIEQVSPPAAGDSSIVAAEVREGSNRMEIGLPPHDAGWLIITDTRDPGWTVWVDGEPVPIHIANGYQMAIPVEAESKEVVLRYRPSGLTKGVTASAASLVAVLSWWAVAGFRRRRTLSDRARG